MSVTSWGDNTNGQLGDGTTRARPILSSVDGLGDVRQIEAGSGHVVAVLTDGTAVAWGRNIFGQVSNGSTENQNRPVPVRGLDGPVRTVSLGGGHSMFLMEDGTLYASGAGFFGCLAEASRQVSTVPVRIEGLPGPVRA